MVEIPVFKEQEAVRHVEWELFPRALDSQSSPALVPP